MSAAGNLDWKAQGACLGADADLWFPGRGKNQDAKEAKAVCLKCPVRQECLDYAIANVEKHGVWGGKSERERRKIRLARNTHLRLADRPATVELHVVAAGGDAS